MARRGLGGRLKAGRGCMKAYGNARTRRKALLKAAELGAWRARQPRAKAASLLFWLEEEFFFTGTLKHPERKLARTAHAVKHLAVPAAFTARRHCAAGGLAACRSPAFGYRTSSHTHHWPLGLQGIVVQQRVKEERKRTNPQALDAPKKLPSAVPLGQQAQIHSVGGPPSYDAEYCHERASCTRCAWCNPAGRAGAARRQSVPPPGRRPPAAD